jgi:glycine/D-amino acid oxidase-like deaminating enzyme
MPVLMLDEIIVVVGGGIIGTSIAAHLQGETQVILFEKNDLLGGGTTADSIGMFGWSYDLPLTLKRRAWEEYEDLSSATSTRCDLPAGACCNTRLHRRERRKPLPKQVHL